MDAMHPSRGPASEDGADPQLSHAEKSRVGHGDCGLGVGAGPPAGATFPDVSRPLPDLGMPLQTPSLLGSVISRCDDDRKLFVGALNWDTDEKRA